MIRVQAGCRPDLPLLVDVPHSGRWMPEDWRIDLPREAWERSADLYVDELLVDVWDRGVDMLVAEFPRVYCDVNRAANDFDPQRLARPDDPRAAHYQPSAAALKGMGVCWSTCGPERFDLWPDPPSVDDIEARLTRCWQPYEAALHQLREQLRQRHGGVLHLNMHSMARDPDYRSNPRPAGRPRPDIEIGTLRGATAHPALVSFVADQFRAQGFSVEIDQEFIGQDILRRHADPAVQCHSLQVEINRGLYLDDDRHTRSSGFLALRERLSSVFREIERRATATLFG